MAEHSIKVDAMYVPEQMTNEAAKDYEQQLAKVCAWIDSITGQEVSFYNNPREILIEFRIEDEEETQEVLPGNWIVFFDIHTVLILSPEQWEELQA